MNTVKKNYQDTVFTRLFGAKNKRYLFELYQTLHPEDTTTSINDLELLTIENALTNDIYNDLGFLVRGQLVILAEAQSTWSPNIALRMFLYLARTYQDYIYSHSELKAKLYSTVKIDLPSPELYVIYTGERGDKPASLSLKDSFFPFANLDLTVNIIYSNNERTDIINQYISFCKTAKEQMAIYHDPLIAMREAIRICIEQGYLADFLSENANEVVDMSMILLSQEEITESYGDFREMQGRAEGLTQGRAEGLTQGRSEGSRSHAIAVFRNCIERGMSREEAIAISEIDEADLPQE